MTPVSGQGHQIFIDALARAVAGEAAAEVAAQVQEVGAPLRIRVRGRCGVGTSTVAAALATAGFAISQTGADVDVHVIAEVLKPEDRAVLSSSPRPVVPTLIVLNKADLAGFGPGGPLARAQRQAQRLAALAGLAVQPAVGLLALAALEPRVLDDEVVAALRVLAEYPADLRTADCFIAAEHRLPRSDRLRLVEVLDLFGIAHAVVALRRDPSPRPGVDADALRAVLRAVSGIDEVIQQIERAGIEARYRRVAAVCDELEIMAITDPALARSLADADLVLARMAAAVDVVEAAGLTVDPADNPAAHRCRAVRWRNYASGPVSTLHQRCGTDIVRGSLRLLDPAALKEPEGRELLQEPGGSL